MGTSWKNRGTYGRILKKLIQRQVRKFESQKDDEKAIQLAHNIGYLTNILNNLIKDEQNAQLEKRVEDLERTVKP